MFDGDEGRLTEEAFLHDFAADIPLARARVLYAVQEPFPKAVTQAKTTNAAWPVKPSYYAISTADRTIDPDLQLFMADRTGAQMISLGASHRSLISHPTEVAGLIGRAAWAQSERIVIPMTENGLEPNPPLHAPLAASSATSMRSASAAPEIGLRTSVKASPASSAARSPA